MEPQLDEQQVLIDLGLTLKQARVYLTLVEYEPLRIMEIAKNSKVARPDVYIILEKLKKLNLVEKIIEIPFKYKAVSFENGLSLLLKAKTEQYKKIRAETQILLDNFRIKPFKEKEIESSEFYLIPKGNNVIERIRTAIEKAQQSINLVLSWRRFSHGLADAFSESMEIAWAKKVEIKFIVEMPGESKTAEELVQFCREKPCCQIRFINNSPEPIFGIYDKREVFLIVFSEKDLRDSSALWSNNHGLIALAENYFESLWKIATENILWEETDIDK